MLLIVLIVVWIRFPSGPIVILPRLWIRENFQGFDDLVKIGRRFFGWQVGFIGMRIAGFLAIGLFDLGQSGTGRDAQDLIVIGILLLLLLLLLLLGTDMDQTTG